MAHMSRQERRDTHKARKEIKPPAVVTAVVVRRRRQRRGIHKILRSILGCDCPNAILVFLLVKDCVWTSSLEMYFNKKLIKLFYINIRYTYSI